MYGSVVFARWHQFTPDVILSWTHPSPQHNGISVSSAIFAQLTAKCRRACPGISFPLKIAHWHAAIWSGPRLIHGSLGPPESTPKRHLDRFRHFCTAHGSESLYFTTGHPLPLKAACSHGASEPHLIHGSLGGGPIRVLNPNGISIGPAVLEVSLL